MSKTDVLIKESFVLMDKDCDGFLTGPELVFALRFLGIPCGNTKIYNESSKLYNIDEFSKIAKEELGSLTPQEKFVKTIKQLDKNNDGMLSIQMAIHLVCSMSDIVSPVDIENFKNLIDPNNVGMIAVEELAKKVFE